MVCLYACATVSSIVNALRGITAAARCVGTFLIRRIRAIGATTKPVHCAPSGVHALAIRVIGFGIGVTCRCRRRSRRWCGAGSRRRRWLRRWRIAGTVRRIIDLAGNTLSDGARALKNFPLTPVHGLSGEVVT